MSQINPFIFSINLETSENGDQIIGFCFSYILKKYKIKSIVLFLLDYFLGSGPDPTLINPTVDIPIILVAFLILVVLGTLIGLIPAYMATLVKPIDALRDE